MAMQIVSALFDDYVKAASAVERLKRIGFTESEISIVGGDSAARNASSTQLDDDASGAAKGATTGGAIGAGAGLLAGLGLLAIPGLGPVVAAGWLAATLVGLGTGAAAGGMIGALVDAGIPDEDAHVYAEGVRRGGTLVTVRTESGKFDQAVDILDDDGTVDINERVNEWRNEGWQPTATPAATVPRSTAQSAPPSPAAHQQPRSSGSSERIPIVEEELQVGKRKQVTGRVRIHTHVENKPVQETVTLRDERIRVERRPVTEGSVSGTSLAPGEKTVDIIETSEVPVITKTPRVKEEVIVTKETGQRTETVRDTVRKTEVNVDDTRQSTKPKTAP